MWRIWRVYCGVTRGEMESLSITTLSLHCTTLPHHPSTSLQWTVSPQETCLIMFILVPHAMCLYLILSRKGARNARTVQGNHQDSNDEKQLLSTSDCINPCNQILYYGTTDHNSPNTKSSDLPHKSVEANQSTCHSFNEHKHVEYPPQPPDYKWGSENYLKGRCRKPICKDVGRWCRRQRRQQMLLTYSVLQAFGWGSVFALSWTIWKSHSLYHHSKQQCPTYYWSFQAESSSILFDKEGQNRLLKFCENSENNENAMKNQDIYSNNSFNQRYNYNIIFNPDIDRSLFSYLYSVVSNQPVIKSNVKDKRQTSKKAHNRNGSLSHQTDLEILTSEDQTHGQSYSQKLKRADTPLYQSNNDETRKDVPCVRDKSTRLFEHSASKTGNDDNQNKCSTTIEAKTTTEIVTIEDCSESGISSSGSNECKKIDAPKTRDNAEDIQKVIQQELNAIRAVQDKVNGLLQGDLGLSLMDTDPESAILHFQAGALLGDSDATYNLALCLHMGKGVKQNYKWARKYYSQASKAGHGWATYNLAVLVSEGMGGPSDNALAYALLQTAAERGVREAKEALRAMEEDEEDDLIATNHTGDIGIIARSQSLPTLYSKHSEKVHSSCPRSATMQCIDLTDHFDTLTLSTDLSSNPIALQRPSFYI